MAATQTAGSRRGTVIALMALSLCAPGRAAADPFDGCKVVSAGNPRSIISCGPDLLIVMDTLGGDTNAVQGMLFGISQQAPPPLQRSDTPIELSGSPHKAVWIVDGNRTQYVVTVDPHAEGLRTFMCREGAGAESKCQARLEAAQKWAWGAGPPETIPRDIKEPTLAGRPYKLPAGCEFNASERAGGTVRCADRTIFTWIEFSAGETWKGEEWAARFPLRANTTITPCIVAGIKTKCWNANAPEEDGEVHISDEVVVRGTRLAVMCLHKGVGKPLPSACNSVLSFKPGP